MLDVRAVVDRRLLLLLLFDVWCSLLLLCVVICGFGLVRCVLAVVCAVLVLCCCLLCDGFCLPVAVR